jgi:hypothetical protein
MATRTGVPSFVIRAIVAAVAALTPVAGSAAASCAVMGSDEERLDSSEVVFVGRVTDTDNQDRWAIVEIDEIWWGPDVPGTVEVRGGERPGVGSSVDRSYEVGVRYLFAVADRGGILTDNSCTMTRHWDDGLLRLRPVDARLPAPDSGPAATNPPAPASPVPALIAVAFAFVLGCVVFGAVGLVRRRRLSP